MNDAVKIAKAQERMKLYEVTRDVLTNPALDVIAGFILVEYLQGHNEAVLQAQPGTHAPIYVNRRVPGGGFMGTAAGTTLEAGLVAYLLAGSVSKTAEQIKPLAEALGPLLLKAAV